MAANHIIARARQNRTYSSGNKKVQIDTPAISSQNGSIDSVSDTVALFTDGVVVIEAQVKFAASSGQTGPRKIALLRGSSRVAEAILPGFFLSGWDPTYRISFSDPDYENDTRYAIEINHNESGNVTVKGSATSVWTEIRMMQVD